MTNPSPTAVDRPEEGTVVTGPIPDRPAVFQDRPALLAALGAAVAGTSAGRGRLVVLAGARGVGKTQLAAEYARQAIAEQWPVVAWLDAALIVQGLADLATAAGIVGRLLPGDAATAALHWLRGQPGPCLLVIDSVEDFPTIEPWIPGGGVRVITTTVEPLSIDGSVSVDVPPFTAEEAARYLAVRTGRPEEESASALAQELGHSPLALAQAGAVIGKRRQFGQYAAYLDRLRGEIIDEAHTLDDGSPIPVDVGRALRVSIEAVHAADPGGDAVDLLRILSVLDPVGVDVEVLTADPDAGLANKVRAAIALLVDRSLATCSGAGTTLRVHRLVQLLVREELIRTGELNAVCAAAAAIIDAARPGGDPEDPAIWPLCARLLPHALTVCDPAGDTVWFLARSLGLTGRYHEAIEILTAVVEAQAARYGLDHPDTLTARSNLALFTGQAGDYRGALQQLRRLLPDLERVLGLRHSATLAARGNLAVLTWQAGDNDGALAQVQRLLLDLNRVLGADHPITLQARNNRARFTGQAGDYEAAIHQLQSLLPDLARVLGPDHPDTLALRGNLAMFTGQAGDYDAAIEQYLRLMPDLTRVLGRDHPGTLHARGNLALFTGHAGALAPAIQQLQRLLNDLSRVLGPDHADTLTARQSLEWLVQQQPDDLPHSSTVDAQPAADS